MVAKTLTLLEGALTTRGVPISQIDPKHLARCARGAPLLDLARDRTPRQDVEHSEQSLLFQWAELTVPRIPELWLMYAVPNFSGRGRSKRARQLYGARLRAEGRKRGMLDVCLPVARHGFHSLYVEMKTDTGSLSRDQRDWRERLRAAGHCVYVARSWELARNHILAYLTGSYL